jgi:pSer/pThr/pTyr-binding forkhead associated (FHA) protein
MPALSMKASKLEKGIQEVRSFVNDKFAAHPFTIAINQELDNISKDLQDGKLRILVVGGQEAAAKSVQQNLANREPITRHYQVQVSPVPQFSQPVRPVSPATLVYQASEGESEMRYELAEQTSIRIGRSPDCEIFLSSSLYPYTSWMHTEILQAEGGWVLRDLDSRNGTYINGCSEKLKSDWQLQAGDRFKLSPSDFNACNLEFIFDSQAEAGKVEAIDTPTCADCDIVCFIPESKLALNEAEVTFLQRVAENTCVKVFILADQTELKADSLALTAEWIDISIEDTGVAFLGEQLAALVKRKPEDALAKRLSMQVQSQLGYLEGYFAKQESQLQHRIQQLEVKPKEAQAEQVDLKKLLRQLTEDKDKFFKYVKNYLARSKSSILDEYVNSSILHKVEVFIEQLRLVEVKQDGQHYIQLRAPGKSIGASEIVLQFCRLEVEAWATAEWNRICFSYEGGVNSILQQTHTLLETLPTIALPDSLWLSLQAVDPKLFLDQPMVEVPDRIRYVPLSPLGYILKKLRSDFMMFGVAIGMIATLGISSNAKKAMSEGIKQLSKSISEILPIQNFSFFALNFDKVAMGYFLAVCTVCVPITLLMIMSFLSAKKTKVEDTAQKLRDAMMSHYQGLAKSRVERMAQEFLSTLEAEERRLKEIHDHLMESTPLQSISRGAVMAERTNSEEAKLEQRQLRDDRLALQKLKRLV